MAESTLSLEQPDQKSSRVQRFSLEVVDGPDRGLRFTSTGERTVLGTHASAQLVLHDPTVSRFHCEITLSGRPLLRDLGSRNGTVVDGVSILSAGLGENAVLTLGRTRVRFALDAATLDLPLSPRLRFGSMV